ncbi:hypothetical protein QJS66_05405 [Kocuria rhizophila]|nr:hypothetical protein QJS66_05405 [Kocuria rhizophila]
MGANSHNSTNALRKNGAQEITPIHPELAEPLEEILAPPTPIRVPGAGWPLPKVAGYSLGQADIRCADGQREGGAGQAVPGLPPGQRPTAATPRPRSRRCGQILLPVCTTRSTRRTPRPTGWSRTGPRTSRRTTRPSTWRPCSPRWATTRKLTVPHRAPSHGHHGAAAGRERVELNFTPWAPTSAFGMGAVRNKRRRQRGQAMVDANGAGSLMLLQRFLAKVPAVVCNKRTIESMVKAGASTSSGNTRRGLATCDEQAVEDVVAQKKKEDNGEFTFDTSHGRLRGRGPGDVLRGGPGRPRAGAQGPARLRARDAGPQRSDHPLRGLDDAW